MEVIDPCESLAQANSRFLPTLQYDKKVLIWLTDEIEAHSDLWITPTGTVSITPCPWDKIQAAYGAFNENDGVPDVGGKELKGGRAPVRKAPDPEEQRKGVGKSRHWSDRLSR